MFVFYSLKDRTERAHVELCELQRATFLSTNAEQTPKVISFELQLELLQKVQILSSEWAVAALLTNVPFVLRPGAKTAVFYLVLFFEKRNVRAGYICLYGCN